jgi:hypothetical protein
MAMDYHRRPNEVENLIYVVKIPHPGSGAFLSIGFGLYASRLKPMNIRAPILFTEVQCRAVLSWSQNGLCFMECGASSRQKLDAFPPIIKSLSVLYPLVEE